MIPKKDFGYTLSESSNALPIPENPSVDITVPSISVDVPVIDCPSMPSTNIPLSCHLTYNPKVIKRKRKHGFLARKTCRHGRKTLLRRMRKGRHRLTA